MDKIAEIAGLIVAQLLGGAFLAIAFMAVTDPSELRDPMACVAAAFCFGFLAGGQIHIVALRKHLNGE